MIFTSCGSLPGSPAGAVRKCFEAYNVRLGGRGLSSLACPSRTGRRAGLACLTLTFALAAPLHALDPQKSVSQFTHTAWSGKDGIPGPVRAMAQTQDGYLWLGTEAGLYRFDGLRFTPYEPRPGPHLHGSAILSLLAARERYLLLGLYPFAIRR